MLLYRVRWFFRPRVAVVYSRNREKICCSIKLIIRKHLQTPALAEFPDEISHLNILEFQTHESGEYRMLTAHQYLKKIQSD